MTKRNDHLADTDLSTAKGNLSDGAGALARIRDEMEAWNFDKAGRLASQLESEFAAGTSPERLIIPGAFVLLARAHVNHAEVHSADVAHDIQQAERLLDQAGSLLAITDVDRFAEIRALKASIAVLRNNVDSALALLSDHSDPYAIRTRTALFLNKQKYVEAMSVIEGLEPHARWCDVAVPVYALNGQLEKAQLLLRWAAGLPDRSRYLQCCVRLAEVMLSRAIAGQPKGAEVLPVTVTASEREQLAPVLCTLRPVLDLIYAAGKPSSGLDMSALRVAWQANHLLQRREVVPELLNLMAQWTPVSLDVARGVINGYIEAPSDLTGRLRKDHPNDLDAGIMAAVIDSCSSVQDKEVVAKAKELVPLADTVAKKEELFKLFQQLWQTREGVEAEECEKIVKSLVAHNPLLNTTFEASIALRNKDADRAILILEGQKAETDPYWLQMRANACLLKGQLPDAIEFLLVVAKMTLDEGLLLKTGEIACQAKKYDIAVWCFEKLVDINPDNLPIRNNLAHIYTFVLHDFENAATQFRALRRIEPANPMHTLNLAICLAQLFQPAESFSLYNELCAHEKPSLAVVMGRAQLHHSMGHPEAALTSLEPFRDCFWGDPNFVMAYMNTAYAAGREDAANDAMLALNRMQKEGAVKPEAFRAVPQNEALEMFKQSFKQSQDRNEHLHAEMLKGQMPWVWAEQMSNNAIYWGWRTRTQKMDWIGDEPINLARFCIYATNGFHARDTGEGIRALLPLKCPPRGSKIVADVSALITLHRLGLLDTAAEYFDEVLVPAGYLQTVLEDSRQMVLNQRSRQQSAEQISKQINAGRIVALAETAETPPGIPLVDEYSETAEHRYRLVDITQPLYAAGILSDVDLARVSHVTAKPSAVNAEHPALVQFQSVMVDLTTLETMAHSGLLAAVTGFFNVRITAQSNRNVIQNLNAIAWQEETRGWHMDLWNGVRKDSRFRLVVHTVPDEMRSKGQEVKDYIPFLSNFIAQETHTPLLADDRVCQAFMLGVTKDAPNAAFGSDTFILALLADGKIDSKRAADAFRQLITWRYRFLIPPPAILKVWADNYRGNPPGQALREVAEYVHDCMRDPGLFGGSENTALGDSMAMRAYLTWDSNIADFLVLVWADESFTPDVATRLTGWSCNELLPSCPMVADGRMKVRVSDLTLRLFLSHVLVKTANRTKVPRMADAMRAIKDALRLSDEEYQRIVLEILNDTARTATHS